MARSAGGGIDAAQRVLSGEGLRMTGPRGGVAGAGQSAARLADARLAAALAGGDERALGDLYDQHGSACYALARRILVDPALAQDAVQEAFVAAWTGAGAYDPGRAPLRGWLLMLVHRKAVDLVRREQRHAGQRLDLDAAAEAVDPDAQPVEELAAEGVRRDRVRGALAELPEPQREVVALAYFGGYTQREVAALTGAPLGTVKTRTMSALSRLRQILDSERPETGSERGEARR
jgi:RNA polymerase sigma factor (sigma-70 family)